MTIPTPPSQANVAKIVGLMCQSVELANSMRLLDAVACLDAGLLLDPGFFPCRLARARMLAEMERFDEALADLNYVLRQAQLPDVLASFAAILEAGMAYVEARLTTRMMTSGRRKKIASQMTPGRMKTGPPRRALIGTR